MRSAQSKPGKRIVGGVLAATVAAGAAVLSAPAAGAERAEPGAAGLVERTGHYQPAGDGEVGTRSSSSGGRANDFTGDGISDLLGRDARAGTRGDLRVYPHSGVYNGTATFDDATTISHGWSDMRWLGTGDLTGDGYADLLAIDQDWNMLGVAHSGEFDGTDTFRGPIEVIGSKWYVTDLVYTADINGDGFDDVLARVKGTGDTYLYLNRGGLDGRYTLDAPVLFASGGSSDVFQGFSDVTLDGYPDLVFVQDNGILGAYSYQDDQTYAIGRGWQALDAIVLTDIDMDGTGDIVARQAATHRLVAYTHTGLWSPKPDGTAFETWTPAKVVGRGWHIYDVIT